MGEFKKRLEEIDLGLDVTNEIMCEQVNDVVEELKREFKEALNNWDRTFQSIKSLNIIGV